MLKKVLLTVAALGITTSPVLAGSPYISGNVGYNLSSDDEMTADDLGSVNLATDGGFAFTLAAGYAFTEELPNTRVELELKYAKNDIDTIEYEGMEVEYDDDRSSLAFMANAYYDFNLDSAITPFVMAGMGAVKTEIDDYDDTEFAWQIGVGASYAASERMNIDLQYRYVSTSDSGFEDVAEIEWGDQHQFLAGLRYSF